MPKEKFSKAQIKKNDEFYTQYSDIQKEVNAYIEYNPDVFKDKTILLPCDDPEWSNFTKFFAQNFERFGLKKLISTSYAYESKQIQEPYQLSLFEKESPNYDEKKTKTHGKIFTLDRDMNESGKIDIEDLKWDYLDGDGDFRSEEVIRLRDEADIIITNPPFSLFREFVSWLQNGNKKFIIIGNINCISYKEIFPLLKNNLMWVGYNQSKKGNTMFFEIPEGMTHSTEIIMPDGKKCAQVSAWWFTNIDHGRRHQPLQLMTMEDNLKFSKHKDIIDRGYPQYDNYDAIEVSHTDSIPKGYKGAMGVPISFMDKYNPDQFEILGLAPERTDKPVLKTFQYFNAIQHNKNGSTQSGNKVNDGPVIKYTDKPEDSIYYTADNSDGYLVVLYARIIIKFKDEYLYSIDN